MAVPGVNPALSAAAKTRIRGDTHEHVVPLLNHYGGSRSFPADAVAVASFNSLQAPPDDSTQTGQVAVTLIAGGAHFVPPDLAPGIHFFDIEVTFADLTVETVHIGALEVIQDITKNAAPAPPPAPPTVPPSALHAADYEGARVTPDDDAPVLQALFDAAALALPGTTVVWAVPPDGRATWQLEATVTVRGDHQTHIPGPVLATAPLASVLVLDLAHATFSGPLIVTGHTTGPAVVYGNRQCDTAILATRARHCRFGQVVLRSVKRHGVDAATTPSDTQGCHWGTIEARDVGSAGAATDTYSQAATATAIATEGSDTATTQRGVLTLDAPLDVIPGDLIRLPRGAVPGQSGVHVVTEVTTPTSVKVYPKPYDTTAPQSVVSSHGAALRTRDRVTVDTIDVQRAGVAVQVGAPYGPSVRTVIAQATSIPLQLGVAPTSTILDAEFGLLHLETIDYALVKVVSGTVRARIGGLLSTEYDADAAPMVGMGPRAVGGHQSAALAGASQITIAHRGAVFATRGARPRNVSQTVERIAGNSPELTDRVITASHPTITLVWDEHADLMWGSHMARIVCMGNNHDYPRIVTLRRDTNDVAGTINGSASNFVIATTPSMGPIEIHALRDVSANNWTVWHRPLNG